MCMFLCLSLDESGSSTSAACPWSGHLCLGALELSDCWSPGSVFSSGHGVRRAGGERDVCLAHHVYLLLQWPVQPSGVISFFFSKLHVWDLLFTVVCCILYHLLYLGLTLASTTD